MGPFALGGPSNPERPCPRAPGSRRCKWGCRAGPPEPEASRADPGVRLAGARQAGGVGDSPAGGTLLPSLPGCRAHPRRYLARAALSWEGLHLTSHPPRAEGTALRSVDPSAAQGVVAVEGRCVLEEGACHKIAALLSFKRLADSLFPSVKKQANRKPARFWSPWLCV